MAEIYKGVWEDDQGNKLYSDNDTETTRDSSGIPLNNGGDLSEASVNFTVGTSRKALTPKARFKALMGDIAKWLTDLGPAAFYKVADDFTTTAENYLFTARKGKQLKDEIDGINSDLGGNRFGFTSDGQPGYKKAGADTVYPFKSNISFGPYQTFQGEGNNGKDGYGCIVASRSVTAGYYMFYVTGYYIREGNGIIDNVVLCNGSTNILSSGRLHSQNGVCSNVILYQLTSNATLTIKLYLSTARGVGQGICNFQQIII